MVVNAHTTEPTDYLQVASQIQIKGRWETYREARSLYKRKISKQGYDTHLAGQAPALDAGLSLHHGTSRGKQQQR